MFEMEDIKDVDGVDGTVLWLRSADYTVFCLF